MSIEMAKKTEQSNVINSDSLNIKEEEAMKKRLRTLEDIRDGKEIVQGLNYESRSPIEVEREIAHLRRVLDAKGAKMATGNERLEVEKEIKMLETDLRKDMPTWIQYANMKRKDGMNYVRLVNQIMKWERDPVRGQKIKRWKTLKRRIDPSDPTIANTMLLYDQ